MKVAIIGGGLAGISAAFELLTAGHQVELIEAQTSLGGSWRSKRDQDGDWLESGLHWFSRADRSLLSLLEQIGLAEHIRWSSRDLAFALPGGRIKHIPFPALPAGLGALSAVLASELFYPLDKLKALVGLSSAWLGSEQYRESCDDRSYAHWHADHRLPKHLLDDCFDPIGRMLSGLSGDQISARPMLNLFHQLVSDSQSAGIGTLDGSSSERLFDPLSERLKALGCQLQLGQRVQSLDFDQSGLVAAQLESGQRVHADAFVAAFQPPDLLALLPPILRAAAPFKQIAQLSMLPRLLVQVWFDRYVHYGERLYLSSHVPFYQFGDLALCSPQSFNQHNGSLVALAVAPAQAWYEQDDEAIIKQVTSDLRRFWPGARGAKVQKYAVIRTPNSQVADLPNSYRLRPKATTPFANLLLAGNWLAIEGLSPWERAVRSGQEAGQSLIQQIHSCATLKQ